MAEGNFLKRLIKRVSPGKHALRQDKGTASQTSVLAKLMHMLEQTEEVELSCEDVFALLDQFAEMAARGEDVARLMPLMQQHLDMCPDCRQEYEALARILEATATIEA